MKPDRLEKIEPLKRSVVLMDEQSRALVFSPLRLMITLLVCVFLVETLVMLVLESEERHPPDCPE